MSDGWNSVLSSAWPPHLSAVILGEALTAWPVSDPLLLRTSVSPGSHMENDIN